LKLHATLDETRLDVSPPHIFVMKEMVMQLQQNLCAKCGHPLLAGEFVMLVFNSDDEIHIDCSNPKGTLSQAPTAEVSRSIAGFRDTRHCCAKPKQKRTRLENPSPCKAMRRIVAVLVQRRHGSR
jgi:hypothetical protein